MKLVQQDVKRYLGLGMAIALGSIIPAALSPSPVSARMMPPIAQTMPTNQSPTSFPDNLLVSIRREGGFCMQPGCFTEVAILTDGTYRYSTHTSSPITGKISDKTLARLQKKIAQLNPNELYAQPPVANPMDDFCGLAFDGPEVVYTFRMDGQIKQVRGCDRAIAPDHPLVQKLERVYSRISARV